MRVTVALCAGLRDVTVRNWNIQWNRYGKFYDQVAKVPPVLVEKGVEVVDARDFLKPQHKAWSPPVPDDPRWIKPLEPRERADWKVDPAYCFNCETQMYEGVRQACLVAKAQHMHGMPPAVEKLVGAVQMPDRDLLLQRSIMLSQHWNTDQTKQPKRKAPPNKKLWKFKREYGISPAKSSMILTRSLLRLCHSVAANFPSLKSRKHLYQPILESYIMYGDTPIVQQEHMDFLLTSDAWLPPFGGEDIVDASTTYEVPDMWPVFPTADFAETNNYEYRSTPGVTRDHPCSVPHTIIQFPRCLDWTDSQYQANAIMTSLLLTAAAARRRFGNDVQILPEPISIQHVSLNQCRLLLTFFQLNTLKLESATGVKNLVWTAEGQQLFDKLLGQPWMTQALKRDRCENYNGSAFEPFLAAYLNGVSELSDV